jgi:hypothetical protein
MRIHGSRHISGPRASGIMFQKMVSISCCLLVVKIDCHYANFICPCFSLLPGEPHEEPNVNISAGKCRAENFISHLHDMHFHSHFSEKFPSQLQYFCKHRDFTL